MSATRKLLIEIAAAVRTMGITKPARVEVSTSLADVLTRHNPSFDRARFLTACGVHVPPLGSPGAPPDVRMIQTSGPKGHTKPAEDKAVQGAVAVAQSFARGVLDITSKEGSS